MYRIYANKLCIHDGLAQDATVKAAEATLTEEDNCAGSLEFLIPPGNIGYDAINLVTTDVVVSRIDRVGDPETCIWLGRAIRCDTDFYNRKSFYCEGSLSFLIDTIQEKQTFEGTVQEFLQLVLDVHNSKVNQNRRINLGTIQTSSSDKIKAEIDYATTLDVINACLIEKLGGHVLVETPTNYVSSSFEVHPTLNYYSNWRNSSAQPIDFGKNLLDMTRNFDVTDIVTAIFPRGSSSTDENGFETYVDISSVNNGSKVLINQDLKNKYGYIEKMIDFSEIEEPQALLEAAQLYFSTFQYDDVSIEVSAFDMSYLRFGNQTDIAYSPFRVLDKVHCVSKPHGLDRDFPITKIVTDLLNPAGGAITLNSSKATNISSMREGNITINQIQQSGGFEQIDSDIYATWEPAIYDLNYYDGYAYDNTTNRVIRYGIYYPIRQNDTNYSIFKYLCSGEMIPLRKAEGGTSIANGTPYSYNVLVAYGYISLSPVDLTGLYPIYDMDISLGTDGTYILLLSSYAKFPAVNIITRTRRMPSHYTQTFANLIGSYEDLKRTKIILSFSNKKDAEKYIEHVLSPEWKGARKYSYISKTILNSLYYYSSPETPLSKSALPLMASGLVTIGDIKDGRPCGNWKDHISFYMYNPLFGVSESSGTKDLYIKGMMEGDYDNGTIGIRDGIIHSKANLHLSSVANITVEGDSVDFRATKIFF